MSISGSGVASGDATAVSGSSDAPPNLVERTATLVHGMVQLAGAMRAPGTSSQHAVWIRRREREGPRRASWRRWWCSAPPSGTRSADLSLVYMEGRSCRRSRSRRRWRRFITALAKPSQLRVKEVGSFRYRRDFFTPVPWLLVTPDGEVSATTDATRRYALEVHTFLGGDVRRTREVLDVADMSRTAARRRPPLPRTADRRDSA
mmetsp:Transcript_49675/g.116756  ORF Transcript_49675/g.116756 Transcript_49675/m.116756 type:complete len:204 (+) Transcript_49675:1367-1978(+)